MSVGTITPFRMGKPTACGGGTPLTPFSAQRILQDAGPAGPAAPHGATIAEPARAVDVGAGDPGHGPPQNHHVPGAVAQHGRQPHPAELPADGRALARPAMHLARQHGLTGLTVCAQATSKSRAACVYHISILGRKAFETMC